MIHAPLYLKHGLLYHIRYTNRLATFRTLDSKFLITSHNLNGIVAFRTREREPVFRFGFLHSLIELKDLEDGFDPGVDKEETDDHDDADDSSTTSMNDSDESYMIKN